MPVSALVVTLSPDPARRAEALESLSSDSRLTLGELQENRLPVVTETSTVRQGRDLYEAIERTPGVELVALVTLDHSDEDGEAT